MAVKREVRAPRQRQVERAIWLFSIKGLSRIRIKIPATTIVLEWSRADTGVGPSIAEGSQGWSPNCADLPVAARIRPRSGRVRSNSFEEKKICCISQELRFIANHTMLKIRAISPTRLYKTAWRAAVFAIVRPHHQPMSRKDIMPTPSHPINS